MSPLDSRPRLVRVTGSPRSGTTAVGRALAMGSGVCTLHEPFNYHVGLRGVERYFEIPGTADFSAGTLGGRIERMRDLDLRFKSGVFPEDRGFRRILKSFIGGRSRASYRRCKLQPGLETIVWKDPFACFCANVLTDVHDIPVVVTVRNPWAVAASFKRMGWRFDVPDITGRATVAGLIPHADHVAGRDDLDDPIVNSAILWDTIYASLVGQQAGRSIYLVNLDDILEDPLGVYRNLYTRLDLPWSDDVARKIGEMYKSKSERKLPRENRAHDRKRDLSSINLYWQELLGEDEAATVAELAGATWERVQDACLALGPSESAGSGDS